MNLYVELGQFEEPLLMALGCSAQVEDEVRQHVQYIQVGVTCPTRLGRILRVEFGDLVKDELSFRLEIVVPLTKPLGERVSRVGVLGLAENVVLPTGQVGRAPLKPSSPLRPFLARPLLGAVHVS
ncbi:hypothetical protein ACFS2C_22010 [Prauserella oleivorans]|uniref:Uncharacterized protein n=1 Tax=Prauserella oleivorans TaxID=1478153 RepID=A0ABW5WDK1_9PSEU